MKGASSLTYSGSVALLGGFSGRKNAYRIHNSLLVFNHTKRVWTQIRRVVNYGRRDVLAFPVDPGSFPECPTIPKIIPTYNVSKVRRRFQFASDLLWAFLKQSHGS